MNTPADHVLAMRIVDANYNRAAEGLRVVEEYLRFGLEDPHLSGLCKQLRHELANIAAVIPARHLHHARQTQTDVGTLIAGQHEYQRGDAASVLFANLERAQQSMRCLEEYAKTFAVETACQFESLRYRLYTLEKAISVTQDGRELLCGRSLYVLIDGGESGEEFAGRVDRLVAAGVHILQLRDKSLTDRQLVQRGTLLRDRTRGKALFVMNDRPDMAVVTGADGVHVGQDELTVKEVRRVVGLQMLIGVSTHSIDQARQAVLDGASYIGVGPTFPSATKQFESLAGLELLRQVAREISLPAFAIGGITDQNVGDVLAAGARRVAVSHAVRQATDPEAIVRRFLTQLPT